MKKSPLLPIFLIVLVDVLGLTIIIPLLPIYSVSLGASPFVAGLLFSVYGFCQLLAGPVLGRISDRIGRRPVLLVSQVGTLAGFIILANSTSLWHVFLSRIIDGLTAGNISVAQAAISDVTEPKNRAKGFGLIGVAFSIGFLIGPAASGFLVQFGYHTPIVAAAALSAVSIATTWLLLPRRAPAAEPTPAELQAPRVGTLASSMLDPNLGPLLWQFFVFTFAFAMFIAGFPLFAIRRFAYGGQPFDVQHVGFVYAYMGLIGIVVQGGMIGRLVEKYGEKPLVVTGFLLMAAGLAALSRWSGLVALVSAIGALSLGSSILRPSLTSLVSKAVSASEQGVAIGMTQSVLSVSQIVAPMLGGAIINGEALGAWAAAGAAMSIAGGLLALRDRRG